jgi:hypothetical protein
MPRDGVQNAPTGRVAQSGQSTGLRCRRSVEARFWSKVEKSESGCWQWTGAVTSAGYGSFGVVTTPKPRMVSAHKAHWEMVNGPVPAGLVLMHSCDNRRCVRLDHLRVGSVAENNVDMALKGRHRPGGNLPAPDSTRSRTIAIARRVAAGEISHDTAVKLALEACR